MGTRGPIPKRDAERRRRNKPAQPTAKITASGAVKREPCPANLHPEARRWYKSLADSAQTLYWEPSDWCQARVAAIWLSGLLSAGARPSAHMVASWLSMVAELGVTEGARRRMRIEIDRTAGAPDSDVSEMDEYRRARAAAG